MGADLVGGCPHLEADGRRDAAEVLLDVAADHEVGVDLHTDETLDPTVDGLAELAELVVKTGFPFPVTASHCVSLGMQPLDRQREIAEAVAAAGIAVVALPATNLYLQGRDHQQAMPRGLTAVKALRAAGVVVAAGADNLQDPFNPMGRACPFETAGADGADDPRAAGRRLVDGHRPGRRSPSAAARGARRPAARPTSSPCGPARCARRSRSARPTASCGGAAAGSRSADRSGQRQQRVQEHVGAGRDVGRVGVLGDVVRQPADAGREDHRRRADAGEHLGVVAGAARHPPGRVAEPLRRAPRRGRPSPGRSRRARSGPASASRRSPARPSASRSTSAASAASARRSTASSVLRRSTVIVARPGTTLTRSGRTSRRPTVATWAPPSSAVSRRANVVTAAAT